MTPLTAPPLSWQDGRRMSTLVRAFQQEKSLVAARLADADGDGAAVLGPLLTSLYARGREAHPGITVSEEAFGRYLARCAADPKALANVAVADAYLACACAEG